MYWAAEASQLRKKLLFYPLTLKFNVIGENWTTLHVDNVLHRKTSNIDNDTMITKNNNYPRINKMPNHKIPSLPCYWVKRS